MTASHAGGRRRRVHVYVSAWVVAALTVTPVTVAIAARDAPPSTPLLVAACIAFIVLADATEIRLGHGPTSEYRTLLEVGVVTALLTLPTLLVPVTVATAILIHHGCLRHRPLEKVGFNIGQHTIGALAAALVLAPFHAPGESIHAEAILGVLLAMSVYAALNATAIAGLFARLEGRSMREHLRPRLADTLATVLGTSVVGILAVGVWHTSPVLTPLLLSPIAALHLANRGTARAEALLTDVRIERDRLERVLAGASEGIVMLGADGVVQLWNPAMAAITGRSADDACGRHASTLLVGRDTDGVPVDPVMPLEEGTGGTFELHLPTAEATTAVRMTHTLVTGDDGLPQGDVILVRDLSRERAAASLKEDFVARVSHELRTPLSPIRGYAQTLLRAGDRVPPALRREALETIVERTTHLERLIDDLLLVSRISDGAVEEDVHEVEPEVVHLATLARRVIGWVEGNHAERTIEVVGDTDIVAWCDPFRTGQIVTNLLTNACKYSRPGQPIEVRIACDAAGVVTLEVRDHGDGIPTDQLETIFERFQRLDDPQHMTTGGIGLGLWIARRLAELMDGTLDATSRRGDGSTFTLALPAAAPRTAGDMVPGDDARAPAVAGSGAL